MTVVEPHAYGWMIPVSRSHAQPHLARRSPQGGLPAIQGPAIVPRVLAHGTSGDSCSPAAQAAHHLLRLEGVAPPGPLGDQLLGFGVAVLDQSCSSGRHEEVLEHDASPPCRRPRAGSGKVGLERA